MEDEGSPSLASVVQTIMETLSDAVNQLILLVIALQEQNSAMPAHIPPATEAVAGSANTLTEIARNLANDEYEDYPEIQSEIIQACDEMDGSAQGLVNAVLNIQKTSNRKAGWEGLLQASKIISGKTIQIKRLLFTAEQTAKLMESTQALQASSDPESFANSVSELASKANELASQVTDKANDEEAPLSKKNLEKTGDALRERSEKIIELGNELLENPNDEAKKSAFDKEVNQLRADMKGAVEPMKEKLGEITRSNVEGIFQNMTAEPPVVPKESSKPSSVLKRASAIRQDAEFALPAVTAVIAENEAISDLNRAAIRKDPSAVTSAAQALAARTEDLVEKLKESTQELEGETKNNILGAISQLHKHVKEEALASAEVAKNPAKRENRDRLTEALNKLDEVVVGVTDSPAVASSDKLQVYARKEQALLDVLGESVHASDPNAVVEAIKNLVGCQQKLIPLAIAEAQRAHSPERQAQLANAANQLSQLLPQQVQASKAVLEDKNSSTIDNNTKISDKMQDALDAILGTFRTRDGAAPFSSKDGGAEMKQRAKQAKDLGNKLAEAGIRGDTKAVDQSLKDLRDSQKPLLSKARSTAAALPSHNNKKDKIMDALRELDSLYPQQEEAARDLARNPKDSGKRSKLDDLNRRIANDLDELSSMLADVDNEDGKVPEALKDSVELVKSHATKQKDLNAKLAAAGARGDKKAVEQVLRDISDSHRTPTSKARAAAAKIQDPARKQKINSALDDLDTLIPLQLLAAMDLSDTPKDPAKKDYLDQISQRIGDDFAELAKELDDAIQFDNGSRPLDPEVARLIDDAINAAKKVETAASSANNAPQEVQKAAKDYATAHTKLAPKAIAAAKDSPVPFADHLVKRALDNILRELHPKQEDLATKVAQDPTDPTHKEALGDATTAVVAALAAIKEHLSGQPAISRGHHAPAPAKVDHELDFLIEKAKDAAKEMESAKSPQDVARAAKDSKDSHGRLAPKASAAARLSKAPTAENDVQASLERMQNELLPRQEALAKKAVQNPGNHEHKDELKAATDDIIQTLDSIRGAIMGAPEVVHDAALNSKAQSRKAKEVGSRLADAGAKGDTKAIEQALRDLHDSYDPFAENAYSAADAISDPVRHHNLLEALNDLDALLPQQEAAARDLASNPRDARKKSKLDEINKNIDHNMGLVSDALASAANTLPTSPVDPEIARLAEREKALAQEVASAAIATPAGDVPQIAQRLAKAHNQFAPKALSAAKLVPNPSAESHVQRLLDRLQKELPKQEAVAREVAKDQSNPSKKDELHAATNNISSTLDDILDALGGQTSQQAVKDAAVKAHHQARRQKALGNQLAEAAAKGNPKGVSQALKDINDTYRPLAQRANRAAQRAEDPKTSQRVLKALKDLDSLLPQQEQAARALAQAPKDNSKKAHLDDLNQKIGRELDALTDALTDAASAEPAGPDLDLNGLLAKAQDEANGVAGSAMNAAGSDVERATKDVRDTYAKLAPKAKAAARNSPHAFAEPRVAHALHELQYYLVPQQEELARKVAQNPNDEAKKAQLKDLTDKIYDELDEIRDALAGEGASPEAARDTAASAKVQSKKARELGRKLADAGSKGDSKGVDQALKDLRGTHRPLASKARKAAEKMRNPADKSRVLAALADLAAGLPAQEAAARDLARTPKDPSKKGTLEEANRRVARDLETLADALAAAEDEGSRGAAGSHPVDAEINKLISKAKDAASKTEEAALVASPSEVASAVKEIQDTYAKLAPKASAAARKLPHPLDQHHVQKSLDAIAQLLPKQEKLASEVARNPNDEATKNELQATTEKIKDELDNLRQALRGSPTPAALKDAAESAKSQSKKAKDASANLASAGSNGDKKGVEQALKDIRDSHGPLKAKAKSLAAQSSPQRAQPILEALADLDALLPQQEVAARDLSRTPRDQAKKGKLDTLNGQIAKDFDFLSDALAAAAAAAISELGDPYQTSNISPHLDPELQQLIEKAKQDAGNAEAVAFKPSPTAPEAAKCAKEIKDTIAQIAPKATAAAEHSPFPHAAAHVSKTVSALQKELLPKQDNALKEVVREPKSSANKDEVKKATNKIREALDSIVDALSGGGAVPQAVKDASVDVKSRSKKAKELGNKLSEASTKGDTKAVDQALKDIKDTQGPLLSKSRSAAVHLPPATKQRVLDALADLDALLPQQESAARDATRNPRDSAKKNKLEDLNKEIAKKLDVLNDAFGERPSAAPDKIRKQAQKQQGMGAKLASAAAVGNRAAVDEALRDLDDLHSHFDSEARNAEHNRPESDRKRIEEALLDLDALLPNQASAARDAASAPKDKRKKKTLEKVNEQIADRLDDLAALLGDTGPKDEIEELIQRQRERAREVLAAASKDHGPYAQAKTEQATKAANDNFTKLAPKLKAVKLSPAYRKVADKLLDDLTALIPAQSYLALNAAAHPASGAQPTALRDTTNHIEEALSSLSSVLAADALTKEAARVQNELAKLADAISQKRADAIPAQLTQALSSLSSPPSPLLPLARRVAQHASDPEKKHKLVAAIEEADKSFPVISEALKDATGDLNNLNNVNNAKKDLDNAQALVARIAALGSAASPVEDSVALAAKASDVLADLLDAAKKGDNTGVARAAEKLSSLQPKLIRTARSAADTLSDPNRRRKLFGAIDELDDVLPSVVSAAREAAETQDPKAWEDLDSLYSVGAKMDRALDQVADDSGLSPLASGDKLLDDLDNILEASNRADPEQVMEAIKEFVKHQPAFAEGARSQADALGDDGQSINAPVDKIDNDMKALLHAAHEVIKDPGAEAHKRKLAKNVGDMKNVVKAASDAIKSAPPPIFEISPSQEADELTTLVPALIAAAEEARDNPDDIDVQIKLEEALDKLNKPLENVLEESGSPSDQAAASADAMADGLNVLVEAALKGDVPKVEKAAKDLAAKQSTFASKSKQAAAKLKSPERKAQATNAVDDVAHFVPKLIAAAKAVAQNPSDPQAQKQLRNLNRVADDGVKLARNAVKYTRPVKEAHLPEKADRKLKLCGARGNSPADDAAAIKKLRGTAKQLDALVKDEPVDWLKGRKIGDAIADLEKRLQEKHGPSWPTLSTSSSQKGTPAGEPKKGTPPAGKVGESKVGGGEIKKSGEVSKFAGSPSIAARASMFAGKPSASAPVGEKEKEKDKEKELAEAKKRVEAEIDLVRKKKNTPLLAQIHNANDGIRKLRVTAFRTEPARAESESKAAIGSQRRVRELAKLFSDQSPNADVKRKTENAIKDLDNLIPQQEKLAQEAAKSKDPKAWEALEDATVKAEATLAQIGEIVNPTPLSSVTALAKKAKAEVPKLLEAAQKGNANAVESSLKDIGETTRKLADLASKEVEPAKLDRLQASLQDLANVEAQLKNAVGNKVNIEKLVTTAKALYDPLDNVDSIVNDKELPGDDEIKGDKKEEAKKQAKILLATLKPKGGAKLNPNHLIKASQHLAGLMEDLVGKTKVEAHSQKEKGNLTERARAALELDDLLSSMEASAKASSSKLSLSRPSSSSLSSQSSNSAKPGAIQSLESVLASLTAVASSAPSHLAPIPISLSSSSSSSSPLKSSSSLKTSSSSSSQPRGSSSSAKPVSLTDSIIKVAKDIQTRAGSDSDAVSVVSRDLAAELQRFAKADQERRRQDMLISGRAISAHITRLIAEIKTIANQCKDPVLQDKLVKHSQSLRNFGIQLKILSSVKAASTDDSSNNSQLAALTQALGNVISDVSTTITIIKKSKKV